MRIELFRVSHRGEGIEDSDTVEGAREIVQGQPPGRYDVDEIRAEPFPSGHTSRSWGAGSGIRTRATQDGSRGRRIARSRDRKWETCDAIITGVASISGHPPAVPGPRAGEIGREWGSTYR